MTRYLFCRLLWRFKFYVLIIGVLLFATQIFMAYKSLNDNQPRDTEVNTHPLRFEDTQMNSLNDYAEDIISVTKLKSSLSSIRNGVQHHNEPSIILNNDHNSIQQQHHYHQQRIKQLDIHPNCTIYSKEAISALQRAKTKDCRQYIAHVACAIQAGEFYPRRLPSYCPAGNHTANEHLGCFQDGKEYRLLSGYFIHFKKSNTPDLCLEICLQSGYPYAGVEYGVECFCGTEVPDSSLKLADHKCNMRCSGDSNAFCGGYYTINVYETGIKKFTAQLAATANSPISRQIRIAFLLTLNGRALRQIHRLLKSLYASKHVYYIHIDKRQDYLYRELLKLEKFPNIILARNRFSTIWGGASLLTMLLQSMENLLKSAFHWDFIINLSESDFPIKRIEKLEEFLVANYDRNFVKGHGRETQRFIQKQGLDKTFVECDTHMWRIGDRKLPIGIQVDGGSDWVALSRTFVQYIIEKKQTDPLLQGLLIIFQHTLLPAESFFHTVLRNTKFCNTYVDNNLHVTNWKRKLGCKCQYKHVVDWCGCSPNDFKPEDWSRLHNTENKMLFFARKFEPIINQIVITKLERWLFNDNGDAMKDIVNLHGYWQSFFHWKDAKSKQDDLILTIARSVILRIFKQWQWQHQQQQHSQQHQHHYHIERIHELTHYFYLDQYKGYLIRFHCKDMITNNTYEFETRIRPMQYTRISKNLKLSKRIKQFEVSSDYDQKEQISRNFARFLGPYTDLILTLTVGGINKDTSHSYNLTLLWIDPVGRLQDSSEIHIEDTQTDNINYSKAFLKQPLLPGIWNVKLIGRTAIYAQTNFLIVPLSHYNREPFDNVHQASLINGGSNSIDSIPVSSASTVSTALPLSSFDDFILPTEWLKYLPTTDETNRLFNISKRNALKIGTELDDWLDALVSRFHYIRELCIVHEIDMKFFKTNSNQSLPLCVNSLWSSLASDPKSDINVLLKLTNENFDNTVNNGQ